jgi:hypothetical protein
MRHTSGPVAGAPWTAWLRLAALSALVGCGGGGGDSSAPASTPIPPTPPASTPSPAPGGYDVAAQVQAIRQHATYGSVFRDGSNPHAPDGLVLPTPPQASCMAHAVTVTSLAQFNTEAAGTCKRITLAPSATPYAGVARITGQDIEAVFTGTTLTPADGNDAALQVTLGARRIKTIGGSFNNFYFVWTSGNVIANYVQDVHIYGGSFTGLFTQGLSTSVQGDGGTVRAHRFLIERSSLRSASGGLFVEGGSTNVIMANCNVVVPKLTLGSGSWHENPVRFNGVDLGLVLDSRLRTELGPGQSGPIKHTWRTHASYGNPVQAGGRILIQNVQSEGGGSTAHYPGVEGPESQSAYLVVRGWRYYRAADVDGNNILDLPHRNTRSASPYLNDLMNEAAWMDDNVVYYSAQTAGAPVLGSTNVPPGPVTNTVYAPYVAPPAWSFR